jgi:hypothetical protein
VKYSEEANEADLLVDEVSNNDEQIKVFLFIESTSFQIDKHHGDGLTLRISSSFLFFIINHRAYPFYSHIAFLVVMLTLSRAYTRLFLYH